MTSTVVQGLFSEKNYDLSLVCASQAVQNLPSRKSEPPLGARADDGKIIRTRNVHCNSE